MQALTRSLEELSLSNRAKLAQEATFIEFASPADLEIAHLNLVPTRNQVVIRAFLSPEAALEWRLALYVLDHRLLQAPRLWDATDSYAPYTTYPSQVVFHDAIALRKAHPKDEYVSYFRLEDYYLVNLETLQRQRLPSKDKLCAISRTRDFDASVRPYTLSNYYRLESSSRICYKDNSTVVAYLPVLNITRSKIELLQVNIMDRALRDNTDRAFEAIHDLYVEYIALTQSRGIPSMFGVLDSSLKRIMNEQLSQRCNSMFGFMSSGADQARCFITDSNFEALIEFTSRFSASQSLSSEELDYIYDIITKFLKCFPLSYLLEGYDIVTAKREQFIKQL